MAGAKQEMAGVIQRVVLAVVFIDTESAQIPTENEIFEGVMEREKKGPTEQRSERKETLEQYIVFSWVGGSKKYVRNFLKRRW